MPIGQDDGSSFYAVLGVARSSSAAEIRAAYRKLAMLWHPDKCRGLDRDKVDLAKKRFQQVQEAYNVLSDDGKRALYDLRLYDSTDSDNDIRASFCLATVHSVCEVDTVSVGTSSLGPRCKIECTVNMFQGLYDFVGELSSMMADVRTQQRSQNQSFQDLQQTFFDMFQSDLESWGMDFSAHLEKKRTCETTPQFQQVSAKSQRLASVERPRGPCKRRSMNSGVSELKRPAKLAAQTATDLFTHGKDTCCNVRCYVGKGLDSGIGFR